jgi:hypothetical protein
MKYKLKKTATDEECNERDDIDQFGEYILDECNSIKELDARACYISEHYKNSDEEINMRMIDSKGNNIHTYDEYGRIN